MLADVVPTLRAIHQHGLIHGDVHLANICAKHDAEPSTTTTTSQWQVRVIDFGHAKAPGKYLLAGSLLNAPQEHLDAIAKSGRSVFVKYSPATDLESLVKSVVVMDLVPRDRAEILRLESRLVHSATMDDEKENGKQLHDYWAMLLERRVYYKKMLKYARATNYKKLQKKIRATNYSTMWQNGE